MDPIAEKIAEQARMFCNRLRKNTRHRRKWAKRNGIECFRLYDRDVPEIPLSVDYYAGHLYIAEYERPSNRTEEQDQLWMQALIDAARMELDVAPSHVFVKRRKRQRGSDQYERIEENNQRLVVKEYGHSFWVNLGDYLDTGLFLDHRQARKMVAAESGAKHVLNLFAYTGSFTVYAAAAGAASTTTVDLSNTYLSWAEENLKLNELEAPRHRFVRMDVRRFLTSAYEQGQQFDLAVVDPPTFSNSKKMDHTFDIQKNHAGLLRSVADVMRPGGIVYFSTNAQRFQLSEALPFSKIQEITNRTIPMDFAQRRPHKAWRMECP